MTASVLIEGVEKKTTHVELGFTKLKPAPLHLMVSCASYRGICYNLILAGMLSCLDKVKDSSLGFRV